MNTEVYVFADWDEFAEPTLVGSLRSSVNKNKMLAFTWLPAA
jgi:serine/threonine-protein kinase HipA